MQKITNIEIKNFKSIRHAEIKDCRRINIFVGSPNVGKSNILEALGLYSHFQLEDNPFKFSDICRVKHFSELFFNKDAKEATIITNDFMEQLDKNELSIYLVDIKNGETIVRKMSDDEVHEAYQFGYDFFLNLKNFMRAD